VALRFANDLAVELRELHEQSRAYGKLTLHSVSITESGAHLAPLRTYLDQAVPERDIQDFGQMLYQMLHGNPSPSTLSAADIRIQSSATAPARLLASGTKLALRCISPKGSGLSMQQVTTELRVLTVLQRQEDAHMRPMHEHPSAPPRPYPNAPPGWTPPIEMLIDVPGVVPQPPPASIDQAGLPPTSAEPDPGATPPIVPLVPTSFGAPAPKPPAKEAPAGGSCPKCACAVVYESRARSPVELFFERMKFPIVRCHRCYHRYVVIGHFKFSKDMPVGTARKFRARRRHT
jgi:hypothetical protein